jgi:uncharacterized protein (TIGR03437 family)
VTIQIASGDQNIDAILVYVAPNEVAAILPSSTPLGPATITVNNNGVSASRGINVVAAAFGIFTLPNGGGAGTAAAFNVNGDGTTTPNNTGQSVLPGQDILINGTGLGAITSDETQSGATDVPSTAIQVYVGVLPASVVSAGRGTCCGGLDPNFPIPAGIAAWDVIRFTIPDGVVGCFIPVAVQIGAIVSNLATISIDPGGNACTPAASTLPPDLVAQLAGQTGVSISTLSLTSATDLAPSVAGTTTAEHDTGSASFVRYSTAPASMFTANFIQPANVCSIDGFPAADGGSSSNSAPGVPLRPLELDAGPSLDVEGPQGSRKILRLTQGMLVDYEPAANFGNGGYLQPGHYTVTGGGRDVGGFSAAIDAPSPPFAWTNIPDVTAPIDRTQDLTVTWTGGLPGTEVTIAAASLENAVPKTFLCAAPVEAGQLTIPSYVLLSLDPSGPRRNGTLVVQNKFLSVFSAAGLDIPTLSFSVVFNLSLQYQ